MIAIMPSLTVIHTADWHLGVRLREMERTEEHEAFLTWLTDTAEREAADVLIIAGDVFDSANPPQTALRMWYDFLGALRSRCPQCAVVAIAGNHDSPHVLEAARAPLAGMGVQIIGAMPDDAAQCIMVFPDKNSAPALAVVAVPFLRERDLRGGGDDATAGDIQGQLREGLRARYATMADAVPHWRAQGCAVLATGHLTITGGTASESERDIHVGNLGAVSAEIFSTAFDYVALGHLHRPQEAADGRVRYSGSPLPLSFSEWRDAKEVRILTFENGRLTGSRSLTVPCSRPLLRISVTAETLEAQLATLTIPSSPLPAWLEVTIAATSEPTSALAERIHTALAERNAVAVVIRRTPAPEVVAIAEAASIHELQPGDVFEAVLQSESIPDEERAPLHLVFHQLIERHHESLASLPEHASAGRSTPAAAPPR